MAIYMVCKRLAGAPKRKQSVPRRNNSAASGAASAAGPSTAVAAAAAAPGALSGASGRQKAAKRQRRQQGQPAAEQPRRRAKALPVQGDAVEISWQVDGQLKPFCGIVVSSRQASQGTDHQVAYTDGEVHWHKLASETWRVLPPRQPRSRTAQDSLAAIRSRYRLPQPAGTKQAANGAQQSGWAGEPSSGPSAKRQRTGRAGRQPPAAPAPVTPAAAPAARVPTAHHGQAPLQAPPLLPAPSPGAVAQLAVAVHQAAQRAVDEAVRSFAAASSANSDSMLLPFRCLLRAQPECSPLQAIVRGWGGYTAAQRQEVFDAALIVASRGLWSRLEEQLAQELAGQGLPAE